MVFKQEHNKITITFSEDDDQKKIDQVTKGVEYLKDVIMGYKSVAQKPDDVIITEDRMAQRIVLEVLLHCVSDITIKEAKNIARVISVQLRNTFYEIRKQGLKITDEQANSLSFWICQTINSGKDFNQK